MDVFLDFVGTEERLTRAEIASRTRKPDPMGACPDCHTLLVNGQCPNLRPSGSRYWDAIRVHCGRGI